MGYIFEHTRGRKCLVFANSREEAEAVCSMLRSYCESRHEPDRFLIHHGNLSASLRETAEELMRDEEQAQTTVPTSTLELGIDIGRLEQLCIRDRCIGAMAIVGSIQDGLLGDWSTLALKGALDCIIVCTMTASLGRGCIFSALPVAVFQGTITLFAGALSPIMTTAALDSLSLVGSMLIFCVGVNLIRPQTFRTANMLPSVVIAVIYALLF